MKRMLALTTAALMSTGIAGTALAQDAERKMDTGVEADAATEVPDSVDNTKTGATSAAATSAAADKQGDAGTGADAGKHANVGTIVSSLNTGLFGTAEVEGASEVSSVKIIRIDELPGGDEQSAIDEALDRHQDEADDLRAAIEDNDGFASQLDSEDVSVDDVVSVQGNGEGNFIVYVR